MKTWMESYSEQELTAAKNKIKKCPSCGLVGNVYDNFGLRRRKDRKTPNARDYCFTCQCKFSASRVKSNPNSKTNAKRAYHKNYERTYEKRFAKIKEWKANNKDKEKEYAKRHYQLNKEKRLANMIAQLAHPITQICSIDGCNDIGERHHEDYSKPTEIIWLCRKHHGLTRRQKWIDPKHSRTEVE